MSVLNDTTNEGDFREVRLEGEPNTGGFTIIREVPHLDNQEAGALFTTLNAVKEVTDPKVDGKKFTGTFTVSVVLSDEDNQRQVTLRQTLTLVVSTIDEDDAEMLRIIVDPDTREQRIFRQWRHINPTVADTLIATLLTTETYTNPVVDDQVYTGLFVHVDSTAEKQADKSITIVQEIVEVFTTTLESAARLVDIDGDPVDAGFKFTREWQFIAPSSADTLVESRNVVITVTNPLADGQAYSGTFAASDVRSIKQDDNTVIIRELLIRVSTISVAGDMPTPLNELSRETINRLSFAAWEEEKDVILLTYRFINQASESNVMGLADSKWISDADAVSNQAWEVLDKRFVKQEDRTGVFVVLLNDPDFTSTFNNDNFEQISRANISGFGERSSLRVKGQDIAAVPDYVATDIPALLAGDTKNVLGSATFREGEDGEGIVDYTKNRVFRFEDQPLAQTVGPPIMINFTPAFGTILANATFIWHRVSPERDDDVFNAARTFANFAIWFPTEDFTGFVAAGASRNPHQDGSVTITARLAVPKGSSGGVIPSDERTFDFVFSFIEKVHKKPNSNPSSLSESPADGYYWRTIEVEGRIKITDTDSAAVSFAKGNTGVKNHARVMSKTEYLGRGLWKATLIEKRTVGNWQSISLKDAKDVTAGSFFKGTNFAGNIGT